MMTKIRRVRSEPLSIKRVGASVWIFRLRTSLELRTLVALREAFHAAIDCDASDVVVDLATVDSISVEGAAMLSEMADFMRLRNGVFWIAAPWLAGDGYTLRPVLGPSPEGLTHVSPALDGALAARSGGVHSVRAGSAILARRGEESPQHVSDFTGAAA